MILLSLINCPECGREISSKAISCPHCGYPISNLGNNSKSYTVILNACGLNRAQVVHYLMETQDINMSNAYNIINNTPYIISKNISKEKANELKQIFEMVGATITIKDYDTNDDLNAHIKTDEVRCPRCGSNQITTGQRGFSLLTGFIGSNKTVNRCGNCGYSWKP